MIAKQLSALLWAFLTFGCLQAQTAEDVAALRAAMLPSQAAASPHAQAKGGVLALGHRFYKACISSQDYRRCNFQLSCSNFALAAMRERGVVLGFLMGLDRYTRCHTMHRGFYPLDPTRQWSVDPVPLPEK